MSFNKQPNLIEDGYISGIGNKMKSSTQTSETNMMPEYFANKDKLVPDEELVYFQKYGNNDYEDEDGGTKLDDDNIYKNKQSVFEEMKKPEKQPTEKSEKSEKNHYPSSAHETETASASEKGGKRDVDPDDENEWSEEELYLRKMHMLRQLGELAQAGVKLSQNYSMMDDYKTMKFEYDLHSGIRAKSNAVSWMSGVMILTVKGMEMLNDNYNPFDMKFESTWSNDVTTNINSYYDVLGEIYEKYTKPGQKMAPELKLFLLLSSSALTIQMHKGIKNLVPQVAQNLNNDHNMVENLRKEAEERQKREQEKTTRQEKEHAFATSKVEDLRKLKAHKQEYDEMRQQAENSETNNFVKGLELSDTESAKPSKRQMQKKQQPMQKANEVNIQPVQSQNQQQLSYQQQLQLQQMQHFQSQQLFLQKQSEETRRQELIEQNNKLEQIGNMLKNMNAEESFVEHHVKQVKPSQSHTLKGLPQKQFSSESHLSQSPILKLESDNVSKMSSKSGKSSSSRISINPHLEEMFKEESETSSQPSKHSKNSKTSKISKGSKSSSSKHTEIVMNIDDDLEGFNLDESSNASLNIVQTKDDDDFPETFSYGKKSTNSGKRGRPPKTKIKIGK